MLPGCRSARKSLCLQPLPLLLLLLYLLKFFSFSPFCFFVGFIIYISLFFVVVVQLLVHFVVWFIKFSIFILARSPLARAKAIFKIDLSAHCSLVSLTPFICMCVSFVYLQVSWIRKRDLHILTAGILTYTSDERFKVRIRNLLGVPNYHHLLSLSLLRPAWLIK